MSYLTRHVFRRLLLNEPYIYHHNIRRSIGAPQASPRERIPSCQRTIFGFAEKRTQRHARDVDIDPGLEKMMEFNQTLQAGTRPPPVPELVRSWISFFAHKKKTKTAVQRYQAYLALNTLKYLKEHGAPEDGFNLPLNSLEIARSALRRAPKDELDGHRELAKALFAELVSRKKEEHDETSEEYFYELTTLVTILCQSGGSLEAKELLKSSSNLDMDRQERLWTRVLSGLGREDNQEELLKTLSTMEENSIPFTRWAHQVIVSFFAQRDDVVNTKRWFKCPIANDESPTPKTIKDTLSFCMRNKELEWGYTVVFKSALKSKLDKMTWDVLFQWAAALDKGVEEIDKMMKLMVREGREVNLQPDTETINGLVEFANSKNDPYLAERFIDLGKRWRIEPDARTFILQIGYRIDVGDLSGAQAAYAGLQEQETLNDEDGAVVNRLIHALCSGSAPNREAALSIALDLEEQKKRLEPDVVADLCYIKLLDGQNEDVLDLLNAHSFHYSVKDRQKVRESFRIFCAIQDISVGRIWEAYNLCIEIFPETTVAEMTFFMREFFDRGRSDLACLVFRQMHLNPDLSNRPSVGTYVQCLEGVARLKDQEGLKMLHNLLKLEMNIEPNTELYNALMLAYAFCGMPDRALEFWEDIARSREGPTYGSICIALYACEVLPLGEVPAREIWNRVTKMNVQVTRELFAAYVGALAGQGIFDEVVDMIKIMHEENGIKPDSLM